MYYMYLTGPTTCIGPTGPGPAPLKKAAALLRYDLVDFVSVSPCPFTISSRNARGLIFHKAVEMQLAQALVGSFKPLDKVGNVLLIVLPLVSFLGFIKHCAMICKQLFEVIFSNVLVTIDSPLQPHGPLAISVVIDWVEDLVSLGVYQLC